MDILNEHIVQQIDDPVRFVDYMISVFDGFETRNSIKKAIQRDQFLVNGEKATTGRWMKAGDRVNLLRDRRKPKAHHLEIDVLFEDNYLAVVFKPAGIPVNGNAFKTLENSLVDQLIPSDEADALEWSLPVHRLDVATSGLVVFAKTASVRRKLGAYFAGGHISKTYHAVVHGRAESCTIDVPITEKKAMSQVVVERVVHSVKNDFLSLVRLHPETGRTHQLRIHCASKGWPIVGDTKYVDSTFRNKGLMLSATRIEFEHPTTSEMVVVEVGLPDKFLSLLNREQRRWEKYH